MEPGKRVTFAADQGTTPSLQTLLRLEKQQQHSRRCNRQFLSLTAASLVVLVATFFLSPQEGTDVSPVCDIENYLGDIELPGLHVLCLRGTHVSVWKNALTAEANWVEYDNELELRALLEVQLDVGTENRDRTYALRKARKEVVEEPWQLFDRDGHLIETFNQRKHLSELNDGLYIVTEIGAFVWPGVREGFKREVQLEKSTIVLETVSMQPLILQARNFLEGPRTAKMRDFAAPRLAASAIVLQEGQDESTDATQWRTSSTAWVKPREHIVFAEATRRVAQLSRIPLENQEEVQVLRYLPPEGKRKGQKYSVHFDFFDPRYMPEGSKEYFKRRNRMLTVFWYLSEVDAGGSTYFPLAGGKPESSVKDYDVCTGVTVPPETGKVLLFYSRHADGSLDYHSLHGGCTVEGTSAKWAANNWIWPSAYKGEESQYIRTSN
ncbi:MAG: hypothetical protein MHM6MM_003724 [Cercozoa sp. M6MM]